MGFFGPSKDERWEEFTKCLEKEYEALEEKIEKGKELDIKDIQRVYPYSSRYTTWKLIAYILNRIIKLEKEKFLRTELPDPITGKRGRTLTKEEAARRSVLDLKMCESYYIDITHASPDVLDMLSNFETKSGSEIVMQWIKNKMYEEKENE